MRWIRAANIFPKVNLVFGKRTKVAICAGVTGISAWITLPHNDGTFLLIFILSLVITAVLILWGLAEDLASIKYVTIPALPLFYQGSYLLLANALDLAPTGVFVAGIGLGISSYILLLTQNVYNIAAFRSIGLVRAAAVSGTLFIVVSSFLAYGVVWMRNWPFWIITPVVFSISFVLFLLAIWSTHLEEIGRKDVKLAAILSLVLAEIALSLTFWPLLPLIAALVLAIGFYVVLGLTQFELQGRLTNKVVYEYLTIAAVVLALILVTTSWGG